MDPNETLRTIRSIVSEWEGGNADRPEHSVHDAFHQLAEACSDRPKYSVHDAFHQLAEACQALDRWLSRGGFAPEAWKLLDVQWREPTPAGRPVPPGYRRVDDYSIEPLGPPDPAGVPVPCRHTARDDTGMCVLCGVIP